MAKALKTTRFRALPPGNGFAGTLPFSPAADPVARQPEVPSKSPKDTHVAASPIDGAAVCTVILDIRAHGCEPCVISMKLAGELILGHGEACDVQLFDPCVSGRHARLVLRGSAVYIEDMGSKNGTLVDGGPQRIRGLVDISAGANVAMGNTRIFIKIAP